MTTEPAAVEAISDADLVLQFESVGDNCELGLLQRRMGVEPLGLLRFAGAPLRNVVTALRHRFAYMAEPAHIRVFPENGELMVKLTKYDFTYHTHMPEAGADIEAVHSQQCRALPFLIEKFITDLETPTKILVFRQNETVTAMDLVDLRCALSAYGPGTLLWVQPACEGHPPGSVVVVDQHLMVGFVSRLAPRGAVPDLDVGSWLSVLRRVHGRWRDGVAVPGPEEAFGGVAHTSIVFGQEGDAAPFQGGGWSGAEAGYTWSVGERSHLAVPCPAPADAYWLEMDVIPYVRPPLLPRQRLDVVVNGTTVASFDPVARGVVTCVVPAAVVGTGETVSIVLHHPHAASPMLVAGQGDDRRLAVAFRRLTLGCCV